MKQIWQALPQTLRNAIGFAAGVIAIIILAVIFSGDAKAGGNHGHDINLNLTYDYDPPDVGGLSIASDNQDSGVQNSELDLSRAMAAAGDACVFDYAPGWQGCGTYGWSGGEQAFNGSLVTRVDEWMIRINIQTDIDFEEYSGAIGGSWHF
jgi:hypothetical protein